MQFITSENNSLIKEIKSLKIKKYREQKKLYFIEGFKLIEEALMYDEIVSLIIISDKVENDKRTLDFLENIKVKENKIDIYIVSEKILKKLSDTETPQGILAVIKMKEYNLEGLIDITNKNNLFVILDSIQDPGNMGTIIRTADAASLNAIIATRGCVDLYNPKVLRSTMGSIFHIPVIYCEDLTDIINYLKAANIKIYASHLNGKQYYYDLCLSQDAAFIIGNEAKGISDETALLADTLIKIPMLGKAESLNASIAAGILMYETVRQRK